MSNGMLNQESPTSGVAVTPSDSTPNVYAMLYVGTGGDVTVVDAAGNTTKWTAVPTGAYVFCRTQFVKATGTTATNIVGIG